MKGVLIFMERYIWLILLGFFVGTYGTLIGAGGGFVLMPVLLILYPDESPEIITGISLAVVFFNALSGSLAYSRMRLIDYRSGMMFAIAGIPGAVLGAMSTSYIPRKQFDLIMGLLLFGTAIFLFYYTHEPHEKKQGRRYFHLDRNIIGRDGRVHIFSFNPVLGMVISFFIGYISSLLGIGGGIIHVPILVNLLNFPVHIATATSHFILAIMAFTGTAVHITSGTFSHGLRRIIALAIGVLFGAQLGAFLSVRIKSIWIMRSLAGALGIVGIRILFLALK